ncbi:hypothetical protein FCM32_01580 [Mycoplasma bovis]|nr:hypothetical protein [Mycoplasmopsis bovis]
MKKSMQKVEQILPDLTNVLDFDEVLDFDDIFSLLEKLLGNECTLINIQNKRYIQYSKGIKKYIILPKSVTYLGNPHPKFKKRIQIPRHFKNIYNSKKYSDYIFRVFGIYKYKDAIVICSFNPEQYFLRKSNNSSAHIYTTDLKKALKYGHHIKRDKNKNDIVLVTPNNMHLLFEVQPYKVAGESLELVKKLLETFPFNKSISVIDAVKEMKENNFKDWKQSEWVGFYVEYLMKKALKTLNVTSIIYLGDENINKNSENLDFDLFFENDKFFADLKASDIGAKKSIGNDLHSVRSAIQKYNKIWYIIFEHDTVKDSQVPKSDSLIEEWNKLKNNSKLNSYYKKLKHKIMLKNVIIIEYRDDNFDDNIETFNQGKQPDGSSRKTKLMINKNNKNIKIWEKE